MVRLLEEGQEGLQRCSNHLRMWRSQQAAQVLWMEDGASKGLSGVKRQRAVERQIPSAAGWHDNT